MTSDAAHMARALQLAERGRGRTSPNPMVGAVVVDAEGVVIGRGAHEQAGGPHAEVCALRDAGPRAKGATLYCTLEPCSHTGRTGPCAPLVVDAGITRAVIAIEDPNPRVSGRGIEYLRSHGVEVEVGVLADEARRLNRAFVTYITEGRPFVTIKAALSLDAKVAARRGERTAITGAETSAAVHRERAEIDAIGVGSQTVLVDDPLLTVRGVYRARPLLRVVFDRRLRTPPTARLFSTLNAGPVVIVTSVENDSVERCRALDGIRAAGADVEIVESHDFLRSALASLARREMTSLVVEGGPTLQQAFWAAGLVDRVELFVASRSLGPEGVDWARLSDGAIASLAELTSTPLGDDVRIEGLVTHVHRPH